MRISFGQTRGGWTRASQNRYTSVIGGSLFKPLENLMVTSGSHSVTGLLKEWSEGDASALDKLTPLVLSELRRLAHRYMSGESPGHTLGTTALINEAYVRLVDGRRASWQNRAHFFGVCARLMRQILTDFARSRRAKKRGAGAARLSLDEAPEISADPRADLVALDEALDRLAEVDSRKSQVVELRFFGGLNAEETAEVLNVSPKTVLRDWKFAKAWLLRELKTDKRDGS